MPGKHPRDPQTPPATTAPTQNDAVDCTPGTLLDVLAALSTINMRLDTQNRDLCERLALSEGRERALLAFDRLEEKLDQLIKLPSPTANNTNAPPACTTASGTTTTTPTPEHAALHQRTRKR